MVRTRGPAASLSASGTIGSNLTFGHTARGHYARKTPRRTKPPTDKQLANAAWMRWLIRQWSDFLLGVDRAYWDDCPHHGSSPYHGYLRYNSLRWHHGHGPSSRYPASQTPPPPDAPSSISIWPEPRQNKIYIYDGAEPPDWAWAIHRATAGYPALIPSTLRALHTRTGSPTIIYDVGDPAVHYYYCIRGLSTNGLIGAEAGTHGSPGP